MGLLEIAEDASALPADQNKTLLCKSIGPTELFDLVGNRGFTQIVQEVNPLFDVEVSSSLVVSKTRDKFFDFPLSTILSPGQVGAESESKAKIVELPFHRTDQKEAIFDSVLSTVGNLSPRMTLLDDVRLVMDELYSNALFNAPFVSQGKPIERTEKISIDPQKSARLAIGADSERLVLLCEDQFGSLDLDGLVQRLKRCLENGKGNSINHSGGGAGIGTFMIFETCISLYVGVDKGNKTIFACIFPIRKSYRRKGHDAKNVHFLKR